MIRLGASSGQNWFVRTVLALGLASSVITRSESGLLDQLSGDAHIVTKSIDHRLISIVSRPDRVWRDY